MLAAGQHPGPLGLPSALGVLWFCSGLFSASGFTVPVRVPTFTRTLDWPFVVGTALVASLLFAFGGVGRVTGGLLAALGVLHSVPHVVG
jgi:hypothetical protein